VFYKIRYCVEWKDAKLGWVVAQSFHSDPNLALHSRTINDQWLIQNSVSLVEIPEEIKDDILHFNIIAVIHVDPSSLCEELRKLGFHWDKILDLSDGFWNESSGLGVIHPEANMGLPEDTLLGFNRSDKKRFFDDLRSRGNLVTQITGKENPRFSTLQAKIQNTRAYFAGKDMADIIARIQIHKIMSS
jgi:hypothetical protein